MCKKIIKQQVLRMKASYFCTGTNSSLFFADQRADERMQVAVPKQIGPKSSLILMSPSTMIARDHWKNYNLINPLADAEKLYQE